MFKRINVGYNEMALVFKNRDLYKTLGRGVHVLMSVLGGLDVRIYDTSSPRIKDEDLLRFADHPVFSRILERRDVRDDQRLIVWQRDRVAEILAGGTYFFWANKEQLKLEVINIDHPVLRHDRLAEILSVCDSWTHLRKVTVKNYEKGLLYIDGQFAEILDPGPFALWSGLSRVDVHKVDMRSRQLTVTLDEVFSSDGIDMSIKVGLGFKALDPLAYFESFENITSELERKANATTRSIAGKSTATKILENTPEVIMALKNALVGQRLEAALEITDVQILDVATDYTFKQDLAMETTEALRAKGAAVRNQADFARLKDLETLSSKGTKIKLAEIAATALSQTKSLHIGGQTIREYLASINDSDEAI